MRDQPKNSRAGRGGGQRPGEESYNTLRRRWVGTPAAPGVIAVIARAARLRTPTVDPPWRIFFQWHEPDRMRDPDNVDAGGRKLILDALQVAGVLPGDSARYVRGGKWEMVYPDETEWTRGGGVYVSIGGMAPLFIPHVLPGENEMSGARERGARRHQARAAGGGLNAVIAHAARAAAFRGRR